MQSEQELMKDRAHEAEASAMGHDPNKVREANGQ